MSSKDTTHSSASQAFLLTDFKWHQKRLSKSQILLLTVNVKWISTPVGPHTFRGKDEQRKIAFGACDGDALHREQYQ